MPSYHLFLRADGSTEPQRIDFEDLAKAISYVEQLDDFIKAELWCGKEYLASVHSSRSAGKVWTVGQPEGGNIAGKKEDGP